MTIAFVLLPFLNYFKLAPKTLSANASTLAMNINQSLTSAPDPSVSAPLSIQRTLVPAVRATTCMRQFSKHALNGRLKEGRWMLPGCKRAIWLEVWVVLATRTFRHLLMTRTGEI